MVRTSCTHTHTPIDAFHHCRSWHTTSHYGEYGNVHEPTTTLNNRSNNRFCSQRGSNDEIPAAQHQLMHTDAAEPNH